MININSDYESLKLIYNGIYEPKLKIKLLIKKYLITLKILENKYNGLNESNKAKVTLDNYITYYIGRKLFQNLDNSIKNNDKELEKQTIRLIKKEIQRINEYKDSINTESKYCCRLTQDKAKNIMLEYMSEDEIDTDILKVYPETIEDLLLRSNIRDDSLTNKFKDGSIVQKKLIL